ncbi:MAG: c-type cytochrome [Gemmataceae bacterium]
MLARFTWVALLCFISPLWAKAPVVASFERFHAETPSDRGGRLLATELGCFNCHISTDKTLLIKQGPVLSEAGSRLRIAWLRRFLADPQSVKPGTTMPHSFAADPEAKDKVEALVHLLASTGQNQHGRTSSVTIGRDLYGKVGCVACHGALDAQAKPTTRLPSSVPLGDLVAKYTLPGLTKFLQDPTHARPSGRMPRLLNAKEAADVASYLLQEQKLGLQGGTGTMSYKAYHGDWDTLPDFSKLKPVSEGLLTNLDLSVAGRESNYAIVFEGYFVVKNEGKYTFTLASDDGSKLFIDNTLVIDNDGVHGTISKSGSIPLKPGVHKARIEFFQAAGGAELSCSLNGPGLKKTPLQNLLSANPEGAGKPLMVKGAEEDALTINPALVAKGKKVFATAGCANCHTLKLPKEVIEPTIKAPAFATLAEGKGCLADKPVGGVPHFGLSQPQKKALAAAMEKLPPVQTPQQISTDTMMTFNCYACHQRDKVGGVQPELDKWFQTVQPEMGDEGRLPPSLDGAGAKLQADYVKQILHNGANHRPYMLTRMPGFGDSYKGGIVAAWKAVDKLPAVPEVQFEETLGKVKSAARNLVSGNNLGCVKCHTFNGKQAEGVQGIDLTLMPKRLERDWFHAYISDPQKIRPGTRMPASFVNGKSVLPEVLDGSALQQIEAMWLYLKDGAAAQLPPGVGQGKYIPLTPTTTAILYRNFIEGAGPRAIAVGYPEKAHLAFDANGMQISLLWQGEFMNAGRHWTDRGVGYEPPAGDNILRLPGGAPFAKLATPDAAWPSDDVRKLGWSFKGYRLDDKERPTFLYRLGEMAVEDFPAPEVKGKQTLLRRTFTLTAPAGTTDLTYRAMTANKIEATAEGVFKIDGTWTLRAPGGKVRKSAGKDEILVPVIFKDGKATFSIEYVW